MLDRISIAAPCSADWDKMAGSDQVRHCVQCDKNVYNLSAMTRRQAEAILRETEGRLCARLYCRADGTILTENCPAGLRAMGRRISRVVGAAMSAMATLSSAAGAQFPIFPIPPAQQEGTATVAGVVEDRSGGVIANATVDVTTGGSGKTLTTRTDIYGRFRAERLSAGNYVIRIQAPGFQPFNRHDSLGRATQVNLKVALEVGVSSMGGAIVSK